MAKIIQTNQRNSLLISLLLYIGRLTRMVTFQGFLTSDKSTLIRSLLVTVLAILGVVGGVIPEFSWQKNKFSFNYFAYSQDFNDTQIVNYANVVLSIEPLRQDAYQKIQKIIGRTPPNIACDQKETFKGLPNEAQKVAVNYCNQSRLIVQNSGLSVNQFNDMTLRVRSDQELKRRVQNAMIRIRQKKRN